MYFSYVYVDAKVVFLFSIVGRNASGSFLRLRRASKKRLRSNRSDLKIDKGSDCGQKIVKKNGVETGDADFSTYILSRELVLVLSEHGMASCYSKLPLGFPDCA